MYTMDVFRNADLADLNNALGDARADEATKERLQDEQDKKDDDFNSTLESITQPIAGELLRKPIEDLSKKVLGKVSGAIRSRVSSGIKSAAEQGKTFAQQKLSQAADKFGVKSEDLDSLRSGFQQSRASRFAPERETTTGRATSAVPDQIDGDARSVLNKDRILQGRSPLKAPKTDSSGEPVEVNAFTGKPVVRQAPEPQPFTEPDDWVGDLYDKPLSHINPGSAVPNAQPKSNPLEFSSPDNPTERFAGKRLNDIFRSTDTSSLPTPSFKPEPKVQPSTAGDAEPVDQLHPLRQLFDLDSKTASQNKAVLQAFKNSDGDLTTGPATPKPVQLQGQQPPPDTQPASSAPEPTPTDPTKPPEPEPPTDSGTPPTTVNDSDVNVASSRAAGADGALEKSAGKTAKSLGTDALESLGEGEAALGGPEDPLADIVGLGMGLATLFGGIFGGKKDDKVIGGPDVNAGVQQGVY